METTKNSLSVTFWERGGKNLRFVKVDDQRFGCGFSCSYENIREIEIDMENACSMKLHDRTYNSFDCRLSFGWRRLGLQPLPKIAESCCFVRDEHALIKPKRSILNACRQDLYRRNATLA